MSRATQGSSPGSTASIAGHPGRVVVITGASAGVGRATAIAFAKRGWRVALLARGEAGLEGARLDVERAGGTALVIRVDVADAEGVNAAAEEVVRTWSRIDVWVNSAMVTVFGPAERVTPAEWERVTAVTYLGVVHGTLAALRHMRPHDAGSIVQVGSALTYRPIPLQAPYCGAKAAVRGFNDALRTELLHDRSRVRLSIVHLPGINTPQFSWSRTHMSTRHQPVGRVYAPEVAAEAIVKASVTGARELWVGAPAVEAILANLFAPGLLDRYLSRSAYEPQKAHGTSPAGADILFEPSLHDHGAHGPYSDRERPHGMKPREGMVRGSLGMVLLGGLSALMVYQGTRGRQRRR